MNKNEQVYDFIVWYQAEHDGKMPPLREIATEVLGCPTDRLRSGGIPLAQYYVKKLVDTGRIEIKRINKVIV